MKNYLCVIYFTLICLKVGAENKDTATVKLGGSNALANIANQAATNTENDSQRVANIFYWVAHNIQFDTKAFNKSEKIKYRTSKEILKSKKANATEYATLMKDLCELVGVKAMVILGYEKNDLYEDGAGFYGPNSAWNAVLIGNKWQLLDVCNAAGNTYMNLSWWKKQMQKLHKKKLYTSTKIEFKYEYNPQFLFQDPEEVRLSRVPIDPIWQLTDSIIPLMVFEKNEADIKEFNEKYSKPKQFAITLSEVYNLTEDQYVLECAERTYEYNPRYTEMKARRHLALANEKIKTVAKTEDQKVASEIVNKSKAELDTSRNILTEQKKVIAEEYMILRKVNNEKRTDVTKFKQTFTTVNNKHLAALNSRINNGQSKSKSLQADNKAKAKRINDIKYAQFAKAKAMMPEKSEQDPEILKISDSLQSRKSKISILEGEINMLKNKIAVDKETKKEVVDSMNVYIKLTDSSFYKEAVARSKKQDSFDDSIKVLRSKLYYYKVDKLDAFQTNYFALYDTILANYEQIKKHYTYILDASRKNSNEMEALKKMSSKVNLESAFDANGITYKDAVRAHINNNLAIVNYLNSNSKTLTEMKNLYSNQNAYFDFLINNEETRKEHVKKLLDKAEEIDKKHNEQKKEMVKDYKEELDQEFLKVKKRKKKK